MASRKQLKKSVNYIVVDLFTECLIRCVNATKENKVKLESIMVKILTLQNEYISRISHTENGNEKEFYKKFREDFNNELSTIVEEISEIK